VRNGVLWILGFVLSFVALFLFLMVYAFAQPSLWLPVMFAMAFYGLLLFAPRISMAGRVGLALLFGSGSCILWMVSGSAAFLGKHAAIQLAFQVLLGVVGFFGLLLLLGSWMKAPPKSGPSYGPVLILMLLGWLISYFSSSHGGASPMVAWVMHAFSWSQHTAESVIVVCRKIGHFTFYGVIALAGFAVALKNGSARKACLAAGLLTALSCATFDEMRQSTQVDRTGSIWDVALDMAGASTALLGLSRLPKPKKAGSPKAAKNSSTL
jgi:VanZ family protein